MNVEPASLSMAAQFGVAFGFLLGGFFFVFAGVTTAKILAPRNPYDAKLSTYECGEEPVGSPWIRFNIRYYMVALLFLIFDVEVLFIIPWAVEYQNLIPKIGVLAFVEMIIFIAILFVGLIYCWVKGHLEWILNPTPTPTELTKGSPIA